MAVMKDTPAMRKRLEKAKKDGTLERAFKENAKIESESQKKKGISKKKGK